MNNKLFMKKIRKFRTNLEIPKFLHWVFRSQKILVYSFADGYQSTHTSVGLTHQATIIIAVVHVHVSNFKTGDDKHITVVGSWLAVSGLNKKSEQQEELIEIALLFVVSLVSSVELVESSLVFDTE